MHHAINRSPAKPRSCVLCSNFERISGANTVQCRRFGHHSPARETLCAFWEREPGADDVVDPNLWREVMERQFPPRAEVALQRRTPAEVRAIMGANYTGATLVPSSEPACQTRNAVDEAEELEALAEALGPVAWREFTTGGFRDTAQSRE